jgi:hypothetical protein
MIHKATLGNVWKDNIAKWCVTEPLFPAETV